jgi:hypothetical protein
MAGFGVFRNYQKASMVALAILSMLAFFVLPPLLQFGGRSATLADTPVATWKGGELRESGIDRAVTMKRVVNRFLAESTMAAGRDPAQAPQFAADEQRVVRTMLLAEEARKNGITVSDAAINQFLGTVTGEMVRPEQFEEIMRGLRAGAAGVSQHDLFESIREELLAINMLKILQRGFFGDPPGLRWDYFRRMEQSASVEVVPVDVRSVGAEVKLPPTAELRSFFEKHKEDLPNPRSDKPGFREPHRAKAEFLVAKQGLFVEEISQEITDADIKEFYEAKKATMFRARPAAATPAAPAAAVPANAPQAEPGTPAEPAASEPAGEPAGEPKPADAPTAPAEPASPATEPAAVPEPTPTTEGSADPAPSGTPSEGSGAGRTRSPFRQVAFQEAAAQGQSEAPAAEVPAAAPTEPAAAAAATTDAAPAETPAAEVEQFEPLEAVTERIRQQLARERATAKIDILFDRISSDLEAYNQAYALWKAREEARGIAPPTPPDVAKIASLNGLEGGQTPLQSDDDAFEAGGIGRSFEFIPDPGSRFGVRQLYWLEMVYGQGAVGMRAIRSRDNEGNRYLSWRTEDQPEFVPTFETARPVVEQAWKIVEGRSLARKRAEEIAAKAGTGSFESAIAGDDSLQAFKAGPFFWLSPQAAASGTAQVSQPAGIVMPGDEFMAAVFSLTPGATAVAFNEPKTVCYCVRLLDIEPPVEKLRERFVASRSDPRRVGIAAQDELSKSFGNWIEGLEARYKLDWKRKPRR